MPDGSLFALRCLIRLTVIVVGIEAALGQQRRTVGLFDDVPSFICGGMSKRTYTSDEPDDMSDEST